MESQAQTPKLLDQVRSVLRLHHYSLHTERSYIDWIKRYPLGQLGPLGSGLGPLGSHLNTNTKPSAMPIFNV